MAGQQSSLIVGLFGVPLVSMSAVLMVMAAGGANVSKTSDVCGGGGTGQTIGNVTLDAEQMANAQTIVAVTAGRHLPVYAAIVAIDTAYTESTLHNSAVETDHDSEGLFQQRISIYTKPVADDPVKSTNALLDHLVKVANWQTNAVGVDAQSVQISKHPERYPPNVAVAEKIVGQLWPTAAGAAGPSPTLATTTPVPALPSGPAICAGGGGALSGGGAGKIVGATGNNVAGTTTVPTGFVISGSVKGAAAVRFALAQLGKPYVFAAAGPDAFDCSGLTMAAWATQGVALPHYTAGPASSAWQVNAGTPEAPDLSQSVGGDLVFIPGSDGTKQQPGHVGLVAGYVDKPDGRHLYLVQAPMTGIPVELTEATEWNGQVVAVRHIA